MSLPKTTATPKLLYAGAVGRTIEEQRAAVLKTDLHQHGNAVLVWVNQGDLILLEMAGMAERARDHD